VFIGKKVLVRSDKSGVFVGRLVEIDHATRHVLLSDSEKLSRWSTDGCCLDDLVAKGIKTATRSGVVEWQYVYDVIQVLIFPAGTA
jgi:hypothetical protein